MDGISATSNTPAALTASAAPTSGDVNNGEVSQAFDQVSMTIMAMIFQQVLKQSLEQTQ